MAKLKGIREICDHMRIGKGTLYELLDDGLPVAILGNAYRADSAELDQFYREWINRKTTMEKRDYEPGEEG